MANYVWRGTGANAALATNWNNTTTGQSPATTAPGSGDAAAFAIGTYTAAFAAGTRYASLGVDAGASLSQAGSVAVSALSVGLSSISALTELGDIAVAGNILLGQANGSSGTLTVGNGGRLSQQGSATANYITVGTNGAAFGTGSLGGRGSLAVQANGTATLASDLSIGQSGATGTVTVAGTGAALSTAGHIYVGGGPGTAVGGGGTLSVTAGGKVSLTGAADPASSYLQVGNSALSSGTVTVDGAGSLLDVGANAAAVGNGGGTGTLTVSGGAALRAASSDNTVRGALNMGVQAGSNGTLTVTGQGSTATLAGVVLVGRAGTARLVLDKGATLTGGKPVTGDGTGTNEISNITIGSGQSGTAAGALFGGNGAASITGGSTLHSLGNLNVGSNGTTGTLLVDGGSVAYADGTVNIGNGSDRPGGVGTVTVRGGSTLRALKPANGTAAIAVASGPGNTGTLLVTGANSLLDGNGGRISVGTRPVAGSSVLTGAALGTLTIADGATALAGASIYSDTEAAFQLGRDAAATGTATITGTGSRLLVSGLAVLGGGDSGTGLRKGGTGTLNASNGALFRASSLATFAGGTLNVDATSTAVIGTGAGTVGTLTVDAGAAISGTGTINAAVSNNGTISTGDDVLGGTLTLNGAVSGTGTLRIGRFGSLALTGSSTESISFVGGVGTLRLAASGTGLPGQGTIGGFANGDRLVVADPAAPVDTATWSQTSAAGGTLSLSSGGAAVGTLNLLGDYTGYVFNVQQKAGTATIDLAGKTGGTTTSVDDGASITVSAVNGNGYVVSGSANLTFGAGTSGNLIVLDGNSTVNDNGGNVVFGGAGGGTINGGAGSQIVVGGKGALTVNGGSGGGTYFGQGSGSTIKAGSGAQSILVGAGGDKLYSAGSTGDLFGVNGAGDVLMDGTASTGNDVFFGAAGTGNLTFLCGSGDDVLGVGQGQNTVVLGSGRSTVFANTGTTGVTSIQAGSGSADIGFGGASVNLVLAAAAKERTFNLYNYVSGPDKVTLSGYGADAAAAALAGQFVQNGSTVLTLGDQTRLVMIGVTRVDGSLFA